MYSGMYKMGQERSWMQGVEVGSYSVALNEEISK